STRDPSDPLDPRGTGGTADKRFDQEELAAERGVAHRPHDERSDGDRMTERIAGERGIPPVNRVRSMQSRVTAVLAIGCMAVIGVGLLSWYYTRALTREHRAEQSARSSSQARARGEMIL